MHLRYQFQTYLEKERKKYAQLLQENERLVLEVKDANLENCMLTQYVFLLLN